MITGSRKVFMIKYGKTGLNVNFCPENLNLTLSRPGFFLLFSGSWEVEGWGRHNET